MLKYPCMSTRCADIEERNKGKAYNVRPILIIPGPKQPTNLDPYLLPTLEALLEMGKNGLQVPLATDINTSSPASQPSGKLEYVRKTLIRLADDKSVLNRRLKEARHDVQQCTSHGLQDLLDGAEKHVQSIRRDLDDLVRRMAVLEIQQTSLNQGDAGHDPQPTQPASASTQFTHHPFLTGVLADTPARLKLVKWIGVGGYLGCGWCLLQSVSGYIWSIQMVLILRCAWPWCNITIPSMPVVVWYSIVLDQMVNCHALPECVLI